MTNKAPLNGFNILITRPHHQAHHLCECIRSAGGNSIILPTLEIESMTNHPVFQHIIEKMTDYDIAIFVSANAVNHAMPYWPEKHAFVVIAIGPGTAKTLIDHGITIDAIPKHFSSEGILALPALQQLRGKKTVIFCGENSRPLLRETVIQRGAIVDEAIAYRRRCPTLDNKERKQILSQAINLIVSTSQESLENLFLLFQSHREWLCQIPLLVISPTMAARAQQLGFSGSISVADNATDAAVVQAILRRVQ